MSDATYQSAGYGSRSIGWGQRPAIVVVDLQRAFTEERFPLGKGALIHRATENAAALLQAARSAGVPVANVYTAYSSPDDAPLWKVAHVATDFIHGRPEVEFDPRIWEPGHDAQFCKSGPSAFFQTAVITYLTRLGVDTVVVTGCTTSGCVRATVIDAFSYGFRVMVPEPCVGDMDEGPHRDNLRDVGRRYADILDLDQAIAGLTGKSQAA